MKGKVQDVLEAAKAKAGDFMEKHNLDLDLPERFDGAVQKAKEFIEKAKDMSQEEIKEALQKGKEFFMAMAKKLFGKGLPVKAIKPPTKLPKTPKVDVKKITNAAEDAGKKIANGAEDAGKKLANDAKKTFGKLFG